MSYELHFGFYFILNAFQDKKEESGPGAGQCGKKKEFVANDTIKQKLIARNSNKVIQKRMITRK